MAAHARNTIIDELVATPDNDLRKGALEQVREYAQQFVAWLDLSDEDARAVDQLRKQNRNGIDAVCPGGDVSHKSLESCERRGCMRRIQAVKVDGDGYLEGGVERWVEGWEFDMPPLTTAEREVLFAWVCSFHTQVQRAVSVGLISHGRGLLAQDLARLLGLRTKQCRYICKAAGCWS